MRLAITDSYSIEVPHDVLSDLDDRTSSFWMKDSDTLLQFSSKKRYEGEQVPATTQLDERLGNDNRKVIETVKLNARSQEQCGAIFKDEEGIYWLYYFLVWPDLTIFATISSRKRALILGTWATAALGSIERIGQDASGSSDSSAD